MGRTRTEQEWIDEDLHVKIFKTTASPRWYCQYNSPGEGQKKVSLRTKSKKEAQSRARKIARDLEAGVVRRRSNRAVSIAEAADQHLKYLQQDRGKIGPKTAKLYRRHFDELIHWGKGRGIHALAHLTPQVLSKYERTLRDTGVALSGPSRRGSRVKPNSVKTLRDKLKAIRGLIRWAVKQELIERDPSANYELPPKSDRDGSKIEVFTPEELTLILGDPDPLPRQIWHVYVGTGMRADELCWLLKDDLDTEPWRLWIKPKTCPQTGEPWRPKHNRSRVIPIVDPLLQQILEDALYRQPGPWLFHAPGTRGKQVGRWQKIRLLRYLHTRLETLGIDHGTLHTFRHTFATFLANQPTVPLPHVQQVLGHADIATTMGYVHPSRRDIQTSLKAVDHTAIIRQDAGSGSSQLSANRGGVVPPPDSEPSMERMVTIG